MPERGFAEMKTDGERDPWPAWLQVAVWGIALLFSVWDFIQKTPLSLPWILRYGAFFFAIFANMLPRVRRVKWLLAGTALGMLIASLLVDVYFRSPMSTLFR